MIAGLLAKQIAELFIIIAIGFIITKLGLVKTKDSKVLSTIALYVINPCIVINSFQVEYSEEIQKGLIYSFLAAILIHILYITLATILKKIFKLNGIEMDSIIYTNCGNLIIPIILALFGKEWVIYTTGYILVQTLLVWTHGVMVVCETKEFDIKKVLSNINVIACILGIALFALHIQFPSIITETMDSITSMVGPLCMLVAGMLIADMDIKKYVTNIRMYLLILVKMLIFPLAALALLKICNFESMINNGKMIFLITLLGCSAPTATIITQLAQVYDKDSELASAYYFITTLLCIVTMPMLTWLFQTI